MKARIQKWGNSLAVRIPKAFAAELGLEADTSIELSVRDDRLVIERDDDLPEISLDELLAGVTDENIHEEIRTGPAVGNEVW